jgi:chromate transporter
MLDPDSAGRPPSPGVASLFFSFLRISVMGFGGVMPLARWMLVEKRGWLTPQEFNEAVALCQFLPGGNVVNLAVVIGNRFCGIAGAVVSVIGMMIAPCCIVLALAALYSRYGAVAGVTETLHGVSAAGAGLVAGMAFKMALAMKGEWAALGAALVVFVAVGIFRVPLLTAVVILSPLTIAYAWRRVR